LFTKGSGLGTVLVREGVAVRVSIGTGVIVVVGTLVEVGTGLTVWVNVREGNGTGDT